MSKNNVSNFKKILLVTSCIFVASCQSNSPSSLKEGYVTVMLQDSDFFKADSMIKHVKKGEDVTFSLTFLNGSSFLGVDYKEYTYEAGTLTLYKVLYSVSINIEVSSESVTYYSNLDENDTNSIDEPKTANHIKHNLIYGDDKFKKDGYQLTGWNSKKDGSGVEVMPGGRIGQEYTSFYAQWIKEEDISNFDYIEQDFAITITKYKGNNSEVVIPKFINNKRVIVINENSFTNSNITSIRLPSTIKKISSNAFNNLNNLKEIYCYDSITSLYDNSFNNCPNLSKMNISASIAPSFSATYFDAFQDKLDYLESIKDKDKIVLFSGSSTRYGYVSPLIKEAFKNYEVSNMGVFAYFSADIQLDVINSYLKSGDVIIDAPEFDSPTRQFFYEKLCEPRIFRMFESGYERFTNVDIREYDHVFQSFASYCAEKELLPKLNYSLAAKNYDDDMNKYDYETYNIYGDMTIKRPNNKEDERIYQDLCNYTTSNITKDMCDTYNERYQKEKNLGIDFLFTYAPKNIRCLTEESTDKKRNELEEFLKDNIKAPIISKMSDSLMKGYYFFEIDNHLSDEGAIIRTNNVINDLKNYFYSIGKILSE